jgi:anti-anti-sigma factor
VPGGLLTLEGDGTVVDANRTLLDWIGRDASDVVGRVRIDELLSVGGRIFWETHLRPLLHVEQRLDEVLLELRTPAGRTPVLMTAVVDGDVTRVLLSSAVERTRFERELLAARRAADRSASHVRALQEVTSALSRAVGINGVGAALLDAAVDVLGAAAASLWLADSAGALSLHGSNGELLADPGPPPVDLVARDDAATVSADRVVVQLRGHAILQGVLSLLPRRDAAAEAPDLEVLTAVGQQAGLALDRAHTYEHSASVARELQHSLLAAPPPDDVRFGVSTTYRPGVEMLEVGGDWHDVFFSGDHVLSFVVGDVVGRGLGAASAMGQLRSAVRAVADADEGPGRLLSRLDRFVGQVEAAAMATVAYAELDLRTGDLRYACAGHPPPLLMTLDGEPRLLWDGRSTPLGAFLRRPERTEGLVRLSPGDRVVLYTDGLIERRGRSLDEGLALLAETAAKGSRLPLDDAVRQLTDRMLDDEQGRDDVCVLVLSWFGPHFERQLPADLSGLSSVRVALGAWLSELGADQATTADLVLAASESIANAAEHGSGLRSTDKVAIQARVERRSDGADEIVVFVRDQGRWRDPGAAGGPGAGASHHARARGRCARAGRRGDDRGAQASAGTSGVVILDRGPERPDGVRVLIATGEVDVVTAPQMFPAVRALVSGAHAVVLDLSTVDFFDSSGVRLVDVLARECRRADAAFRVAAPMGTPGRRVLEMVGMVDGLVTDDLPSALEVVVER